MEHSQSELKIIERLKASIENLPSENAVKFVTLTLHQYLPMSMDICAPGYAGVDVAIQGNAVTISSYEDLTFRIEAKGTLTQREIDELSNLVQNYRNDPNTKTKWIAPPPVFRYYCAYDLLGYRWSRTQSEIPLNLFNIYQKIKEVQNRIH